MEAGSYSARHFRLMSDISDRLAAVRVQILEHHYGYEHFGSFWFTYRHHGRSYRVVFDGKDENLSIQIAIPTGWEDVLADKAQDLSAEEVVARILQIGAEG